MSKEIQTKRMNAGTIELLDDRGLVVGTRPPTKQELLEWAVFVQNLMERWEQQIGDN